MKLLVKVATLAVLVATGSQPCLAASVQGHAKPVYASTVTAASATVSFAVGRQQRSESTVASMSLAASQRTASETVEKPRRKGASTTTLVIIGGVILAVLLAAAVASAAPTAGPPKGAFD